MTLVSTTTRMTRTRVSRTSGQLHHALLEALTLSHAADAGLILEQRPERVADDGLGVDLTAIEVDDELATILVELDALHHREVAHDRNGSGSGTELDADLFARRSELGDRAAGNDA